MVYNNWPQPALPRTKLMIHLELNHNTCPSTRSESIAYAQRLASDSTPTAKLTIPTHRDYQHSIEGMPTRSQNATPAVDNIHYLPNSFTSSAPCTACNTNVVGSSFRQLFLLLVSTAFDRLRGARYRSLCTVFHQRTYRTVMLRSVWAAHTPTARTFADDMSFAQTVVAQPQSDDHRSLLSDMQTGKLRALVNRVIALALSARQMTPRCCVQ